MAIARSWRTGLRPDGPYEARLSDVPALNRVFSDSFTERYRRDGLVGVRVPSLNPAIWRYAIEDADGGAMLWRDDRDEILAFNVVHCSGVEGWMGPLAVRPDAQGTGVGTRIVRAGVEWLEAKQASPIGLETMPRTMDNIGFYSRIGFLPNRLTITMTIDALHGSHPPALLGRMGARDRDDAVGECRALLDSLLPGYDFTRELLLTSELGLGDTLLFRERGKLVGFGLCHTTPLVEGRIRDETRVLKLVLARGALLREAVTALADFARRHGTRRAAFRVQTEYVEAYRALVAFGAQVRWTDLRMTLEGHPERRPGATSDSDSDAAENERGLVWSNWEI
ncbi:MAG TPA: GNAT family N-acetyltransferase [Gemmatimonadaceae bacterium]|nr:GNAT family N-acetyltransferase [Gemmatimonadaceae bacterium]